MIIVEKYNSNYKALWDKFVLSAKNSHFMFCRDYMDYHSDRFKDNSLIFMNEDRQIVSLLPANVLDDVIHSHQGLTFGGMIFNKDMKTLLMIEIIDELIKYLKNNKIRKLIYKHIPYIYSTMPAQEDLYALYKRGAKLCRVDVASVVDLDAKINFSRGRKRGAVKALNSKLKVIKSNDFKVFHEALTETLEKRHGVKPIHSLSDIELLANRFPENISIYSAVNEQNTLFAGLMVFDMNHWAHVQCTAYSQEGQDLGALDLLHQELINTIYSHKKFYTFGISTENDGKILNNGLIAQKEGFGAMAIVHNFFELDVDLSYSLLKTNMPY